MDENEKFRANGLGLWATDLFDCLGLIRHD